MKTGTRYLSGSINSKTRDELNELGVGVLCQPGNSTHARVNDYPAWAADNGAFRKGAKFSSFDFAKWWRYVSETLPRVWDASSPCLFVTAPDAIDVSDDGRTVRGYAKETIERGREWLPKLNELGFPTAFVGQNGMEETLDEVPWELFDVLFIGGSDEWKLGAGAATLVAEAKRRGKLVHMGRVNSAKRFAYANALECDTADGTFLAFGPEKNLPRLRSWLEAA